MSADAESRKKIGALPDLKVCRVKDVVSGLSECLTENPGMCRYAVPFGYSFFCLHPERKEFTAESGFPDSGKLKDAASG